MLAKIQKSLVIISIVTVGLAMALLIGAIFGLKVFDNPMLLALLLSIAVIAAGCFFANNALDMFEDKKVLSIMCLVLLSVSAILGFIHFWSNFKLSEGFGKFTGIIVITSVLIVIIVTTYGALNKKFLILQFVTYALVGVIDVILILAILGVKVFSIDGFVTVFVIICIVTFALLCATSILGKRMSKIVEKGFVKVSKEEYEDLKQRVKELEEENAKLKQYNN